tara:strand:- start:228 stop:1271 length:1044 start_codon:yes stop_codon:yes gene_type:complete
MAKKSFKDLIFQFLKKDENLGAYGGVKQNPSKRFKVKFAMPNKPNNIAVAAYQFEKDAEKFKKDIIAKGGKAILTKEDAPANATGTAVAGTGDDSSTVVVKKKKELQKKLMTRMGITETIDRTIPNLEYPKDEIRERADQLKELALQSEQFKVRFTDPANKKKFHIIYRSKSEAEAKMAQLKRDGVKQIEIVSEDLDAQPQDRDVKKIKGTQPKKYYKKMSKDDKEKRAKHFTTRDTSKNDNRPAPGDKDAKTKPSIHTKKFKQMYGENLLDEKIKGIENKAKKSGMPYGILKKVYDRGMAAWRGGHRPGATQQQWAFARVNSFVTKSSGTWGGADKDLAKKVRGSK